MAFASVISGRFVAGNKMITFGTWATDTTGGDIDTGLHSCEFITLQQVKSAVIANAPVVNETLPVAGNAVTIVVDSGDDGIWMAIGDF
jgi:hypothetical protein